MDALLSERSATQSAERSEATPPPAGGGTLATAETGIAVAAISASPYQPRRHFDADALQELADSIKRQGLLQPVVVREKAQGGYELIAGERRWRAAQLAGIEIIPAVVRAVSDEQASALALIENMQREDLNAMEEAMGLARLRDEFELTQQQIAEAVGKSRVAIANLLRLMNLGAITRGLLESGALEMGHARALLGLEGIQQDQVARRVVGQALSVRQTEHLVRQLNQGGEQGARNAKARSNKDPDTLRLEQTLSDAVGAPVTINHSPQGKGELTIRYSSLDELDGVLKHLGVGD